MFYGPRGPKVMQIKGVSAWVFFILYMLSLIWKSPTEAQSGQEVNTSVRSPSVNNAGVSVRTVERNPTQVPDPQLRPLRANADLVVVPVTVTDSMNRPVITLTKKDFTVYEQNKPQEIKYFEVEEAPISVAILLDVSKSMSDKIESERQAIVEFFNNGNPNDEYFAITFSD